MPRRFQPSGSPNDWLGEDPTNIEKLHPELQRYLTTNSLGGVSLQHPLVSQPMFYSWKLANEAYEFKTAEMESLLSKNDYSGISYLVERPYRLAYLEGWWKIGAITPVQLRELLQYVWTDAEPATERRWFPLFKAARKHGGPLIDPEHPLPEPDVDTSWPNSRKRLRIYRGQKTRAKRDLGIAWSTDIETARFFARRMGGAGWIVEASVSPSNVFAYFCNRGESEVITHPTFVTVHGYEREHGRPRTKEDLLWAAHAGMTDQAVG